MAWRDRDIPEITMIAGRRVVHTRDWFDDIQRRYSSLVDAKAGHAEVVADIRQRLKAIAS